MIRGGTPEARNPARSGNAAPLHRARRLRSHGLPRHRQRPARRDDHLGPDRLLRSRTSCRRSDEGPSSDDWMTTLLQTKAFHRIPPANIQAIFMRMQRVHYQRRRSRHQAGRRRRFLLRHRQAARCVVTRETPLNKEGIKLAELGVGDTFGEEALISEAKRNATVTMLDRRRADAAQQAGLPRAAERAAAASG